jgi:hypothetical protein
MRRYWYLFASLAVAVVVAASLPARQPGGGLLQVSLTVMRHKDVPSFTNAQVQAVFDEMGAVLQKVDGGDDVPCNVSFIQKGNVGTFSGPNAIETDQDFQTVANLGTPNQNGYNIKVVQTIDFCGVYLPAAVACSPVGISGTSIVVEADYFLNNGIPLAGVIVAHEYGHNRGLSHRSDSPTNLMNAAVSPQARCINAFEQSHYLVAPQAAVILAQAAVLSPTWIHGSAELAPEPAKVLEEPERPAATPEAAHVVPALPPVKDFVRRIHIHGVPYGTASRYTKEDAATLLDMLKDKSQIMWWPNITSTIGFIADPSTVKPLIDFINSEDPNLEGVANAPARTRDVHTARKAAVARLGVIVNKTGDQDALKFLSQLAQTDARALEGFKWLPKTEAATPAGENRAQQITVAALQGLAVSGTDAAAEVLTAAPRGGTPAAATVQASKAHATQVNNYFRDKKVDLKTYFNRATH